MLNINKYEQNINQVTRRTESPRNSNGGTCLDHIITNKHFKPEETIVLDVVNKQISDHYITMAFWNLDSCPNSECIEERDDFSSTDNWISQRNDCRNRNGGTKGAGRAYAPTDFDRPISTRGYRSCPPHAYSPTQMFRPSTGPGLKMWKCPICERKTARFAKGAHRCTSMVKATGTWRKDLVEENSDSNDEENDYPTYEDECEFFQRNDDSHTDVSDNMSQMKLNSPSYSPTSPSFSPESPSYRPKSPSYSPT